MADKNSHSSGGLVPEERRRLVLVLLCLVALAGAAVVVLRLRRQATYEVTFLPALGGVQTIAHGINDHGQVLTTVRMAQEGPRVVVWDKSETVREIDSFAKGYRVLGWLAINNAGQVAGTVCDPNNICRSFLWDPDAGRITVKTPDSASSSVSGLNNRGQIVGTVETAAGRQRAFIWDQSDGMRELGTLGGSESRACGVNDAGQVVGFSETPDDQWHAVLWNPGAGAMDLGISPPRDWTACYINNAGLIAGHFGSATDITCISVWDEKSGARALPSIGGEWTAVHALSDANRLLVIAHAAGVELLGREMLDAPRAYQWDPHGGFQRLSKHLGRPDVRGFAPLDINKEGVMIGSLQLERPHRSYAVLLERVK